MGYPSEVTQSDGTISPATCWDDYALAPDTTRKTELFVSQNNFRRLEETPMKIKYFLSARDSQQN
jgi:hypothetical protein